MTPTYFKFLWRPRSKTRTRLQGRLFTVQIGTHASADSQSLLIERTVVIDMRKAVPLAIVVIGLICWGAAAALHQWMAKRPSDTVDPINTVRQPASLADNVLTSTRSRLETIDNEAAFSERLAANMKAGNNDEIISDLNLARRRSPQWFTARQAELVQLEISLDVRNGDILAMRGAASDYLNGNEDRAKIIIALAQKLHDEQSADAAVALLEEVRRKNPYYPLLRDLLEKWAPSPSPPLKKPAAAITTKSVP